MNKPLEQHAESYISMQTIITSNTQTYQQLNNLPTQNYSPIAPQYLQKPPLLKQKHSKSFEENKNFHQLSVQNNLQEPSYSPKNKRTKSPAPDTRKEPQQTQQTPFGYNCKEPGHFKKNCSRNQSLKHTQQTQQMQQTQQIQQTSVCYNCKGSGHFKKNCPRNQSLQHTQQTQQALQTQQMQQIQQNQKTLFCHN
ncbi:16957_t:CDS:1, partial [Racocetra persica]